MELFNRGAGGEDKGGGLKKRLIKRLKRKAVKYVLIIFAFIALGSIAVNVVGLGIPGLVDYAKYKLGGYDPNATASMEGIDTYSGGSGKTADVYEGFRTAEGELDFEKMVIAGIDPPQMDVKSAHLSYLDDVSIKELVEGTLYPYGEKGDEDPRFGTVTIETEKIQHVKVHPSQKEIDDKYNEVYNRVYQEKLDAAIAAAEAEASQTPSPTAKPSGSVTPSPTAKPSVSVSSPAQTQVPKKQNGGNKKKASSVTAPEAYAAKGKTTPTPANRPTPAPTPSGKPTGKPTQTPTPTPTPITVTMEKEDLEKVQREVDRWVSQNSKEEDRSVYVTQTLDGENLRAYVSSFHSPWQNNYCWACLIDAYFSGNSLYEGISPEAAEIAYRYGNMLDYSLKLNFWQMDGDKYTWSGEKIEYKDRADKLGDCKRDWEVKYDEPQKIDDNTDLISEKGFEICPLFSSIDGWAIKTNYSGIREPASKNSYGFYVQDISSRVTSMAFNEYTGYYDFIEDDIQIYAFNMSSMPCMERYLDEVEFVTDMFVPGSGTFNVDISAFTHLRAGPVQEQAVYRALEIVNQGAVYSQANREGKNSYDCSSLVCRIYRELGINLNWGGGTTTDSLARYFEANSLIVLYNQYDESVMQPGDVILWWKPEKTDHHLLVYHAGIYAGNGMIVDASSSLGHVVYRSMWGKDSVRMVARPAAGQ